jgi:hypothetical protein
MSERIDAREEEQTLGSLIFARRSKKKQVKTRMEYRETDKRGCTNSEASKQASWDWVDSSNQADPLCGPIIREADWLGPDR